MTAPAPGPPEIRDYLLRRMSETARARFEEAYFRDDRLLDRIENEEDRLVADYVMGRLGDPERRLFEDSLLDSPYYRDRVETTRSIKVHLAEERFFRSRSTPAAPAGDPHVLDARLFPRGTGTAVAFSFLVLVTVASLVSAYYLKVALSSARRERAESSPDGAAAAAQAGVVPLAQTVVLTPDKGMGPTLVRVRRPPGGALLLVFPQTTVPRAATLGVALAQGARVLWDSGDLPAREADAGAFAVRVPAGVPAPGNYAVKLRVRGAGASAEAFFGALDIRER